jgi:tRNA pseudouridine13 synthase
MLRRARLNGSRRAARLLLNDLCIEPHLEGLLFTFSLPKGAYATTVLREFMKAEVTALPEQQEGSREQATEGMSP